MHEPSHIEERGVFGGPSLGSVYFVLLAPPRWTHILSVLASPGLCHRRRTLSWPHTSARCVFWCHTPSPCRLPRVCHLRCRPAGSPDVSLLVPKGFSFLVQFVAFIPLEQKFSKWATVALSSGYSLTGLVPGSLPWSDLPRPSQGIYVTLTLQKGPGLVAAIGFPWDTWGSDGFYVQ